ncbi:hypothetical protein MTO96_030079 [Rhipicephalus appendiculatus]
MITPAVASLTNNTDGKDWDTTLPQVQWGINSTLHQATKTTPFGLLFNYRPRNINGDCVDEALTEEFDRQIEAKRTSAAESIRDDQRKQQARYNKKRSEAPAYEPGDVVLVEREPTACGESRKLKEKYKGPYIITEKLPNDRYRIRMLLSARRGRRTYSSIAPVDKLKRWGQDEIDSDGSDSDSDRDVR